MTTLYIGQKVNKLTLIEKVKVLSGNKLRICFKCICDCGNITNVEQYKIVNGHTKSCGCLKSVSKHRNVIKENQQYNYLKTISFYKSKWKCICVCGKETYVTTSRLSANNIKSCGCKQNVKPYKQKLTIGQKINRLTLISFNYGFWNCLCDCGNIKNIKQSKILNQHTKSCGCLQKEIARQSIKIPIKLNTKYSIEESVFKTIFRKYKKRDLLFDINYKEFCELIQKPCYYCDNNSSNELKGVRYNGIDRVNNNLPHCIKNVVPCCIICNRSKSNRSLFDFLNHIKNLNINNINILPITIDINLESKYYQYIVKKVYYDYKKLDKNISININTFYNYSQKPCHYCNLNYSNSRSYHANNFNYIFNYNGIDRVNNSQNHHINNIVPCCKFCNYSKANLSIEEFNNWIIRITNKQKSWVYTQLF